LPAVVRFNLETARERYAEIARLLTGEANADRCATALEDLRARIGLPAGLGTAGVDEGKLALLADEAIADACHTMNPKACTRDDMLALYRAAW
jgi:alcohol dehydrogenase class IV